MNVSVILPSFNPTEKLVKAVEALTEAGFDDIIVINDGSEKTDIFDKISAVPGVEVISHPKNMG